MTLHIERLDGSRIADMAKLASITGGGRVTARAMRHKYDHTGDAGAGTGVLLYDGVRPVACAGTQFFAFRDAAGERHVGAQLGDFFALPEYRGGGRFFNDLTGQLLDVCRARGAAFTYGMTSLGSYRVCVRFGMREIDRLEAFEQILVDTGVVGSRLRGMRRRVAAPVLARLRQAASTDEPLTGNALRPEYGPAFHAARRVVGVRTLAFGRHRVMLRIGTILQVGKVEPEPDPETAAPLIETLAAFGRAAGCHGIRFMLSPDSKLHTVVARQLGPSPGAWRIVAGELNDMPLPLEQLALQYIDYEGF